MVVSVDEPMKEVDKTWTRNEIDQKLGDLSGLRTSVNNLSSQVGTLATEVARLQGRLDGSASKISKHPIVTTIVSIAGVTFVGFQTWMAVTLIQHGNTLSSMRGSLTQLGITVAASTPTSPKSQAEVKAVIADATKNPQRQIPKDVIEQAGAAFVKASPSDPGAWSVARDIVEYRSLLNAAVLPGNHWLLLSKTPNPTPEDLKGKPGDSTAYVTNETCSGPLFLDTKTAFS